MVGLILAGALLALGLSLIPADVAASAPDKGIQWPIDPSSGVVTAAFSRSCSSLQKNVTFVASAQQSSAKGGSSGAADGSYTYECDGTTSPFAVHFPLSTGSGRLHPGSAVLVIGVIQCQYLDNSRTDTACYGGSATADGWLVATP